MLTREQIIHQRGGGDKLQAIADRAGVSRQRIHQILKDEGMTGGEKPRPSYSEDTGVGQVINAAGGVAKLAERFGVTSQSIHKFYQQGFLPLARAKQAAEWYGIPVARLVNPEIAELVARNA